LKKIEIEPKEINKSQRKAKGQKGKKIKITTCMNSQKEEWKKPRILKMKSEARNWICISSYGMHMYDAKDYKTLFNIL
jgi:hypothetical protein